MNFTNKSIVTSGDMSASITSSTVDLSFYNLNSIQAVWTGSPVGVFKLQVSNDGTNFTDVSGSSLSISTSGDWAWSMDPNAFRYVRLVYTRTSGTGTLNVTQNSKGGQ